MKAFMYGFAATSTMAMFMALVASVVAVVACSAIGYGVAKALGFGPNVRTLAAFSPILTAVSFLVSYAVLANVS